MTENVDAAAAARANPHTPVSSQVDSDLEQLGTEVVSEAPGTGEGEAPSAGSGDVEAVATVAAESFALQDVAPDLTGLRPVGEASFGPPSGLETVHGVDNRIQISATNVYPWRVHASLLITARDGSRWIGTGWFIGPHTLVTAGHCVYVKNSGVAGRDGWAQSIQVMAGRNGTTMPYGTVTSSNLRTVTGWANDGNPEYDYGAIIVPSDLGNSTGWFGIAAWSDETLTSSTVNISGYPGDKPSGTQWYHWNRVASVGPRKVYYDIDTYGGQSGSAVYRIVDGVRYGVAVHAYGGATTNSGTRITKPVYDNLVAWKA